MKHRAKLLTNARSRKRARALKARLSKRRANPLRADPTRTATLRRRFIASLKRQFALLKGDIKRLLVDDDAFGLLAPDSMVNLNVIRNAFCATGDGGGVDPSCPPSGRSEGTTAREQIAAKMVDAIKGLDTKGVNFVHLGKLRAKFPKLSKEQFDHAMDVARRSGKVTLSAAEGRFGTSQHDRDSAIYDAPATKDDRPSMQLYASVRNAVESMLFNAFCPTGEGGGVDASCSPGGGKGDEPKGFFGRIKAKISSTYARMKERYGETGAKVVMGAVVTLLPVPIPGTSMIPIGIAEGVRLLGKLFGKGAKVSPATNAEAGPDPELIDDALDLLEQAWSEQGEQDGESKPDRDELREMLLDKLKRVYGDLTEKVENADPQPWRFRSDPEKVKAFQQWLKTQIVTRIRGKTEEQLWQAYVDQGFRQGAGRAFDDATAMEREAARRDAKLDFYKGTRQEFLKSAFGRAESVDKVKLLASRSFDELENITGDMSNRISRHLTDGLVQGQHPREIARTMDDDLDIGLGRARTIAQTEIIRAHAEGQLVALEKLGVEEVGVMVEWQTAGDDAVCERCEALEGVVLKIDEAHNLIPLHPQCLPGHSLVLPVGRVAAVSERFHDGDLVFFRTASGRELSCTPNHPILTDAGWLPACRLDVGDHVVCDGRSQLEPSSDDNHEDVPTAIHQVAEAFRSSGHVTAAKVPLSPPDFHGDGGEGQIAVVWTYGQLPAAQDATFPQHVEQSVLVSRDVGGVGAGLNSLGSKALFGKRLDPARAGDVSSRDLGRPLGFGHTAPLEGFGLALAAGVDAGQHQPTVHGTAGDAEVLGDDVGGVALLEHGDHGSVVDGSQPARSVVLAEDAADDLVRDPVLGCQVPRRLTGKVFLDDVVSVCFEKFSGHVYNLQTESGCYAAEGIITHNCRCAFVPANVGEDDEGQVRGAGDIRDRFADAGLELDIDDERPKSVLNFDALFNSFCATGEGGGVDPTCSPGSTAGPGFDTSRRYVKAIYPGASLTVVDRLSKPFEKGEANLATGEIKITKLTADEAERFYAGDRDSYAIQAALVPIHEAHHLSGPITEKARVMQVEAIDEATTEIVSREYLASRYTIRNKVIPKSDRHAFGAYQSIIYAGVTALAAETGGSFEESAQKFRDAAHLWRARPRTDDYRTALFNYVEDLGVGKDAGVRITQKMSNAFHGRK